MRFRGPSVLKCYICADKMDSILGMDSHARSAHPEEYEEFECVLCMKELTTTEELHEHYKTDHAHEDPVNRIKVEEEGNEAEAVVVVSDGENDLKRKFSKESKPPTSSSKAEPDGVQDSQVSNSAGQDQDEAPKRKRIRYKITIECNDCDEMWPWLEFPGHQCVTLTTGDRSYQCELCRIYTGNSSEMAKHVRDDHQGRKIWYCNRCKKNWDYQEFPTHHCSRIRSETTEIQI